MKPFFLSLALSFLAATVVAQPSAPATGINATMLKMFGDIKTFTARADARLADSSDKEIATMPMTVAMRDNKLRSEVDMTQVKSGSMPPEAAGMLKQMGMDRMVTVVLPERKVNVLLYPTLKAYAEMPFSEQEAAESKVESTPLGDETIDGRACRKTRLTAVNEKGGKEEAIVWQAKDLKNFPIQMQLTQGGNKLRIKFQSPQLQTPDASLFEVPAGYTKYPSVQALVQGAMMKMFGGQEPK